MQTFLTKDIWLGNVLKRDAYKMNMNAEVAARLEDVASEEAQQLQALQTAPVFMFTKVSAQEIRQCRVLETAGFYLVDTNVSFEKAIGRLYQPVGFCAVRHALPQDREGVMRVAASSFVYSRFHLDPNISREASDGMKAEWAGNFFAGKRGDQMVVALVDGQVVGFLQLLLSPDDALVIDLVAVDGSQRGKSIASDMIDFAEHSNPSCKTYRVGTQAANVPSVRLYEKLGFRFKHAQYVFHYYNFPAV